MAEIECPQCGKKAVVQRQEDLYQCLNCDFKRDFEPTPPETEPNHGVFWVAVVAAIVALFILEPKYTARVIPDVQNLFSPTRTSVQP